MRNINVKYSEGRAFLTVMVASADGELHKKMSIATSGESIWKAIQFLSSVQHMPQAKQDLIDDCIAKQKDREILEVAIESWIAAGNQIKVCPPFGQKIKLSADEMTAVMDIVATLDMGELLQSA